MKAAIGSLRTKAPQLSVWLFSVHLWTVFAIALSNNLLALSGLASAWVPRRGSPDWKAVRPLMVALSLLVAWSLITTFLSTDPLTSWKEADELLGLATLPLCLYLVRSTDGLTRILNGIIFMVLLCALLGLAQGYLLEAPSRIRGPFSHYMTFAGVILIGSVAVLSKILFDRRSVWNVVGLIVLLAAMLTSLTRGVWLAFAITAVLMLLLVVPRMLLALPVVAIVMVLASPETIRQRVTSITDLGEETNLERLRIQQSGLAMIADRPLLGHGPGTVRLIYRDYAMPAALRLNVEHLHNSYLQIAAERGLPALLLFVFILGSAIVRSLTGLRRSRQRRLQDEARLDTTERGQRARELLFATSLFAVVAFGLAGLFEDNWSDAEIQRVALFFLAIPFCRGMAKPLTTDPPSEAARGVVEEQVRCPM